jgi:hypothetical protein
MAHVVRCMPPFVRARARFVQPAPLLRRTFVRVARPLHEENLR